MPFQEVPNCTLVDIVQLIAGQRIENTIWVQQAEPPTAGQLELLTDSIVTWWDTEMAPLLSNQISLVLVQATYKGDVTGPQFINSLTVPITGESLTHAIANGAALVVKFGTSNIGRSFRGRNYIAGAPDNVCVDSVFTVDFVGDVLAAYQALPAALSDVSAAHVVVSRRTAGAERPTGIATLVTSYSNTNRGTRSQRRRNPGVGS